MKKNIDTPRRQRTLADLKQKLSTLELKEGSLVIVELESPEKMPVNGQMLMDLIETMGYKNIRVLMAPLGKFNINLFEVKQMNAIGWFKKNQIIGFTRKAK